MLPLLLAGAGLAKSELIDRPRAARDRQMQAEIARYSPWSGMKADPSMIHEADPLGSAMQGGMAGIMLDQNGAKTAASGGSAGAVGSSPWAGLDANEMSQYPGFDLKKSINPGYGSGGMMS